MRDARDNHILAAALGGGAGYLVTGDNNLLTLADDPRLGSLQIITARGFVVALQDATA